MAGAAEYIAAQVAIFGDAVRSIGAGGAAVGAQAARRTRRVKITRILFMVWNILTL
jgi:hypothetical protein